MVSYVVLHAFWVDKVYYTRANQDKVSKLPQETIKKYLFKGYIKERRTKAAAAAPDTNPQSVAKKGGAK